MPLARLGDGAGGDAGKGGVGHKGILCRADAIHQCGRRKLEMSIEFKSTGRRKPFRVIFGMGRVTTRKPRPLSSSAPYRRPPHQQGTKKDGKTAEAEDPGRRGDVKKRARRLECRDDAGQRGDEYAEINQLGRQRCDQLLAGVAEARARHDGERHQADRSRHPRVQAGAGREDRGPRTAAPIKGNRAGRRHRRHAAPAPDDRRASGRPPSARGERSATIRR